MRVSDFAGQTRDATVSVFGNDVWVSYRPFAIKCDDEVPDGDAAAVVDLVLKFVVDWDLTEDDGRTKLALERERLSREPYELWSMLMHCIMRDKEQADRQFALRSVAGSAAPRPALYGGPDPAEGGETWDSVFDEAERTGRGEEG